MCLITMDAAQRQLGYFQHADKVWVCSLAETGANCLQICFYVQVLLSKSVEITTGWGGFLINMQNFRPRYGMISTT